MGARILLIEDNPVNLYLMVYLLQAHDYELLTADDGVKGLHLARKENPDLILCDVQMPEMDGYEFARHLKEDEKLHNKPLIAVTAHAMVGDQQKILGAGFDGYLTKPIDPETFVAQVVSFLDADLVSQRAPQSSMADTARDEYTILVVDNEPVNLMLASSLLQRSGYRVLSAHGMSMGLALARESRPDLILSDVCMEEGNGFDFISAVKADPNLAATPFIFITSTMTTEQGRTQGLALGADKFLFRPMEVEDLLREIMECLAPGNTNHH